MLQVWSEAVHANISSSPPPPPPPPPPSQVEGSPLNSDDDLAEGDEEEGEGQDFETKDNIVCQWEKVGGKK